MKHIFLTGEIQAGKSTVIQKTLSILNVRYGGFRTEFGADRSNPERRLYLYDAALPPRYEDTNVVARFRASRPPLVSAGRFDALGAACIARARREAALIIMDEIGSLEQDAFHFQNEILETLAGHLPVLGVVKLSAAGWVDRIRHHPQVELITVNASNRDGLPRLLADRLALEMRPRHSLFPAHLD